MLLVHSQSIVGRDFEASWDEMASFILAPSLLDCGGVQAVAECFRYACIQHVYS